MKASKIVRDIYQERGLKDLDLFEKMLMYWFRLTI